jgi:peptidoglycan-associated lipoprotein
MYQNQIKLFAMFALLFALPNCGTKKSITKSTKRAQANSHRGTHSDFDSQLKQFVIRNDGEFSEFDLNDVHGNNATGSNNELNWQEDSQDPANQIATIYFEFDKYKVTSADKEVIAQQAPTVKAKLKAGDTVVCEGHACESAGSKVYNMALSEKRAHAVSDIFKAQGIEGKKFKVVGRGDELLKVEPDPALSSADERKAQAPNRRVELFVIPS